MKKPLPLVSCALLLISTLSCGGNQPDNNDDNNVLIVIDDNSDLPNNTPEGCVDADSDGYFVRAPGNTTASCGVPDCDDGDERANPGNTEVCGNDIDDDCAGDGDAVCEMVASCADGVQNGDEEGVDCGGSCEAACSSGALDEFDLAGQGDSAALFAGSLFDVDLSFSIDAQKCTNCNSQVHLVILGSGEHECIYDRALTRESPNLSTRVTMRAPLEPGSYQLGFAYTSESSCDAVDPNTLTAAAVPFGTLEVAETRGIPTEIKHTARGECVDLPASSYANGEELILYGCTSNANQRWTFEEVGENLYRIRSQSSGKCLNVIPGAMNDGDPVSQYDCNGGKNQHVELIARDGGYAMRFEESGKCLAAGDAANLGLAIPLIQKDCGSFERPSDPIFELTPREDVPVYTFVHFEPESTQTLELSNDTLRDRWGLGNVLTFGGRFPPALENKRTLTLRNISFYVNVPAPCSYTIRVHQVRDLNDAFNEVASFTTPSISAGRRWVYAEDQRGTRLVDAYTYYFSIEPNGICYSTTEGNSWVWSSTEELTGNDTRFSVGDYERTAMFYGAGEQLQNFPEGPPTGDVSRFWSDSFRNKPIRMRLKIEGN